MSKYDIVPTENILLVMTTEMIKIKRSISFTLILVILHELSNLITIYNYLSVLKQNNKSSVNMHLYAVLFFLSLYLQTKLEY